MNSAMKARLAAHPWLALLAVAAAIFGLSLAIGGEYATTQTARRTFTIAEDFTKVRKILVRTNGAKQIVTMGGDSEFVDQSWSDAGVEVDSLKLLDPEWKLDLKGTLRVKTKDPYVGEQVISLEQAVQIVPDWLDSRTKLTEPGERLKNYAMHTRFERAPAAEGIPAAKGAAPADGAAELAAGTTVVNLELTQEILTEAPWFAHGIADRRVRASAERTLANQERAIRQLVAENIDDVPLFPLR